MTTDDQNKLLNQISQLAGQINRHKNSQVSNESLPAASVYPYRGHPGTTTSWNQQRRGYSRGGLTKPVKAHRNRSLVLSSTTSPFMNAPDEVNLNYDSIALENSASGWVSKNDRHRQLINASIFEKAAHDRSKAIEETRQQKLKQRQERERHKLFKHFQQGVNCKNVGSSIHAKSHTGKYEVNVQGIRFLVAKNGSKLIKAPGDINSAKCTPKVATVGPVKFYRSKNGNMYRSGIIKAHRASCVVKKVDEPCRIFTTMGILFIMVSYRICSPSGGASYVAANVVYLLGSCHNGPRCRYIHDPSKVAICKEYLQKGSCSNGDSCDLSHELTPERTPSCLHFARGNCSNPNCRYTHVRVSPSALVCRPFGLYGYCEKGIACMERHVNECPDFSNTGTCTTRGCKLLHREKASLMRNKASRSKDDAADNEISDVSSSDENIDSDDVDSEDLEEFFDDDVLDTEIPMQQDFVHLP